MNRRRERIRELKRELARFDPRVGLQLVSHLQALRELLDAHNTVMYNPECSDRGWDLEFSIWVGTDHEFRRSQHRALVRSSDVSNATFAAYDPFAVQAAQRNRVLTVDALVELDGKAAESHRRVWAAIRGGREDQVRVLICQGPRLMGWFGAVRNEPFSPEEQTMMQSLVEPLRAQLLAERVTRLAKSQAPLLEGVLEAVPEPALLLSRHGRVEFANAGGLALLDQQNGEQLRVLRGALASGRQHPSFSITQLDSRGCPGYVLALYVGASQKLGMQVARAGHGWGVKGARLRVLELLAGGRSNKEIAHAIACAEVTVERHVTALFKASGTRSRSELMAKLFSLSSASQVRP